MSIVTKGGDQGTTALMYGRRVMKSHTRVEACGAVDELNAALGLARAEAEDASLQENLLAIQYDLVVVMGELSVVAEDLDRYVRDGYPLVGPELAAKLEHQISALEAAGVSSADWVMPGGSRCSSRLDLARAVCRRAERAVCVLQKEGQLRSNDIIVYLNRLSDLLWLLARQAEMER